MIVHTGREKIILTINKTILHDIKKLFVKQFYVLNLH